MLPKQAPLLASVVYDLADAANHSHLSCHLKAQVKITRKVLNTSNGPVSCVIKTRAGRGQAANAGNYCFHDHFIYPDRQPANTLEIIEPVREMMRSYEAVANRKRQAPFSSSTESAAKIPKYALVHRSPIDDFGSANTNLAASSLNQRNDASTLSQDVDMEEKNE